MIRHERTTWRTSVGQVFIEIEATAVIGAEPYERPITDHERNGHSYRLLSTTAGELPRRIPKLPRGSFPSILDPAVSTRPCSCRDRVRAQGVQHVRAAGVVRDRNEVLLIDPLVL